MIIARATRRLSTVALFAVVLLGADPAGAQTCVSLATLGSAVAQNFDTLASSGTSSALPTGWFLFETGSNADTTYAAGTGSSNTGNTYSFGAAATAERAFGGLQSGTLAPTIGGCFTNATGQTISSLALAYTGEQWRVGTLGRTDRLDFQYSTNATSLATGAWTDVDPLDFTAPTQTGAIGALNGNAAANRTAISSSIAPLWLVDGATIWIRWSDLNASGADDGLAVDDFALTPTAPDLAPIVSATTPANGATNQTPDVAVSATFSEPVTISGTVAIACSGSPTQNVTPTGGPQTFSLPHASFPPLATCTVTFTGTQVNDQDGTPTPMAADFTWSFGVGTGCGSAATAIHSIQGSGASSPLLGAAATVEAIVVADYQGITSIRGFFLEEPNAEHDGDPATSEGLFVFDNNFGVPVVVGDSVRVNGTVSEFQNQSQLSTITSVVVCASGVGLPPETPVTLPFADPAAPERYEGMRVSFAQPLTVTETFNLGRGGILTLSSARLQQPTNVVLPGAPANALQAANNLDKITLDDGSLTQNPDPIVYPPPGLTALNSVRGGDTVSNLAGVLTQGNPGWTTPGNIYRVHPATMPTFTPANPRPAAPGPVGGTLRVSSFNVLNYFTTLDLGPDVCGPLQNQECRGADSAAEFTRQRDKTLQALLALDADVLGLMELENTLGVEPLQDIVNGLNALAGAGTYAFIGTGTLGDDAIKVGLVYQPAAVQPVGAFAILDSSVDPDFDSSLNRPALAQTFQQIATGARFTAVVNHLKSKGCTGAAGLDTDQGDGQSCFNHTRTLAAGALAAWAAGDPTGAVDPDVVLLGDFNAYSLEDPLAALQGAGYTDLAVAYSGPNAYSYVFDAQAGSLDHSLANASLLPQVTGVTTWHVNADEPGVLDYNVEFKSAGQIASLYNADAFRTSDHDPILIGLDLVPPQADLSITKSDAPDPVAAGANLTYTITVANAGPNSADAVAWSDALEAGVTFVSLAQPGGWTCDTPPVGSLGTVSCTRPTFAPGNAVFTLVVEVGQRERGLRHRRSECCQRQRLRDDHRDLGRGSLGRQGGDGLAGDRRARPRLHLDGRQQRPELGEQRHRHRPLAGGYDLRQHQRGRGVELRDAPTGERRRGELHDAELLRRSAVVHAHRARRLRRPRGHPARQLGEHRVGLRRPRSGRQPVDRADAGDRPGARLGDQERGWRVRRGRHDLLHDRAGERRAGGSAGQCRRRARGPGADRPRPRLGDSERGDGDRRPGHQRGHLERRDSGGRLGHRHHRGDHPARRRARDDLRESGDHRLRRGRRRGQRVLRGHRRSGDRGGGRPHRVPGPARSAGDPGARRGGAAVARAVPRRARGTPPARVAAPLGALGAP